MTNFDPNESQSFEHESPSWRPDEHPLGSKQFESVSSLNWIDTFTGVMLHPQQTFEHLCRLNATQLTGLTGAAVLVVLVFALEGLRLSSASQLKWAFLNVPLAVIGGVIIWLGLAGVLCLTAACFNTPQDRVRSALVTLGWSFLPLIFLSPLVLYKSLFGPATVLLMAIPLLWTFILQLLAITESFKLKGWQTITLVFLVPALFSIFQTAQLIQFLVATFSSF
jgi:hypothetical protein